MSLGYNNTIICKKCNTVINVTTWNSINAELNPDLVQQVFDHTLFRPRCPKCKTVYSINYNVLYHDPLNKFMIYRLVERNERKEVNLLNDCTCSNNDLLSNYKLRIVYSENELVEKITIFKENLNDIYIEIIKNMTSLGFSKKLTNNLFGFYFQKVKGKEFIFQLLYNNGKKKSISVPKSLYEQLENKLIYSPNTFVEVNTENAFKYLQLN